MVCSKKPFVCRLWHKALWWRFKLFMAQRKDVIHGGWTLWVFFSSGQWFIVYLSVITLTSLLHRDIFFFRLCLDYTNMIRAYYRIWHYNIITEYLWKMSTIYLNQRIRCVALIECRMIQEHGLEPNWILSTWLTLCVELNFMVDNFHTIYSV